jgi:hypothetical protein
MAEATQNYDWDRFDDGKGAQAVIVNEGQTTEDAFGDCAEDEQMAAAILAAGPTEQEVVHDMEDPAHAWVCLCEATRILDIDERRATVARILFDAKNSAWTFALFNEEFGIDGHASQVSGSKRARVG